MPVEAGRLTEVVHLACGGSFFAADLRELTLIFFYKKLHHFDFFILKLICVNLRLKSPYHGCFRIITYLLVTPSILFFCIAETTTALNRWADMGAWMMWVWRQPVLFKIRR